MSKCGLFSNKHNGMASIEIATTVMFVSLVHITTHA